jgi:hypothetical protein
VGLPSYHQHTKALKEETDTSYDMTVAEWVRISWGRLICLLNGYTRRRLQPTPVSVEELDAFEDTLFGQPL